MDGKKDNSFLLLLIISLLLFAGLYSVNRNLCNNLYYGYSDLIYFEQSLSNFIHGHGLVSTGRGEDVSLFHEHAYFSHFLVSLPFYALFPHSMTLYSLAAVHMIAALIFVFYLARRILKNTGLAWVCTFLFLTNAYLLTTAGCFWRWGFHPQAYYLAYFLAFLYFWDKNRAAAIVFFSLALLTNELYAVPLFMTTLYFVIKDKAGRRTALILGAVAAVYFVLATKWIMPQFGVGKTAYNYYAIRLDQGRPFSLPAFWKMFSRYWKPMLVHFQFLPVLSPQLLVLALPDSLVNTFSEFVIGYRLPANPLGWHSVQVYGFMIWASLLSLRFLSKLIRKRVLVYALSLVCVGFSVDLLLHSRLPGLVRYKTDKSVLASLKKAEELTAKSDSLCVSWGLAFPFMHKRYLYDFPNNYAKVEYILVRGAAQNLSRITQIQTEVLLKTPRLVLLRNLSYRPPPE